jgi:hypothetical protein
MVFAFFLNRGTLVIVSDAPYIVNVFAGKTAACAEDTCRIVVAPGEYNITLKKEGYKDESLKVSIPIGGEHKEEVDFEFIPYITLASENDAKLFDKPVIDDATLPKDGIFYGDNYLAYLERDPGTHRLTLYLRGFQDGKLQAKTAVTSFIRDPQNYKLILSVDEQKKIALIDNTADGATLYMIDLKEKTRTSVFSYPQILDVKWLPSSSLDAADSGNFLFEAREQGDASSSIFYYDTQKKDASGHAKDAAKKLELKTELKNVVPVSADVLIAATNQQIVTPEDLATLEGQLIVLGEREATPQVGIDLTGIKITPPVLSFVDYSLISGQSRLLRVAPDLVYPKEAKIGELKKSVLFMVADKVYELHFRD